MTAGISIFKTRLSPLFDNAQTLLVVKYDKEQEICRDIFHIGSIHPVKKIEILVKLKIDVLICGAISKFLLHHITGSNITVIPHLSGEYEEILDAFKSGELSSKDKFLMPGCCRIERRRCRRRGRGRN